MPKRVHCYCNNPVRSLLIRTFHKGTRTSTIYPHRRCPLFLFVEIDNDKIQQIGGLIESIKFNKFEKIELKDNTATWFQRYIIPPQHLCVELDQTTTIIHAHIINEKVDGSRSDYFSCGQTSLSISKHSIKWITKSLEGKVIYSFPMAHKVFLYNVLQQRSALLHEVL